MRLVIDQSTSGTKLLLVRNGNILKRYDKTHQQLHPESGWVEQDALEIWDNVKGLIDLAMTTNKLDSTMIASLSITNQRETIIAWDKETGLPLYNAIVWQCNRSQDICKRLISQGKEAVINSKTGLKLDPYFSGTKIKWLFENVPIIAEKSTAGKLALGTVDSWLIWNLTQGKVFATDTTNACRTLLFDINELRWDEELLEMFGATRSDLPDVKESSTIFGYYKGVKIQGVMADSQAALVGQKCTQYGEVKLTLGTGASVLMQMDGNGFIRDTQVMTTIAHANQGKVDYAMEGIIRSCADSINWFQKQITTFSDIDHACNLVLETRSNEEVYFIPALQGLASPFWTNNATGLFVGMKLTSNRRDLLRAILESIVFQVKSIIDVMEEVADKKIKCIKVDGGVTKNHQLMKMLATILGKEIIINNVEELSAIGVYSIVEKVTETITLNQSIIDPINNSVFQEKAALIHRFESWKKLISRFEEKEDK
ncbi:FGGY-family carbohydrate kinase [Vagococcus allomyrinae]|nr:FGGY family carbohydrate kinase [Vagococcus allomyrinae]